MYSSRVQINVTKSHTSPSVTGPVTVTISPNVTRRAPNAVTPGSPHVRLQSNTVTVSPHARLPSNAVAISPHGRLPPNTVAISPQATRGGSPNVTHRFGEISIGPKQDNSGRPFPAKASDFRVVSLSPNARIIPSERSPASTRSPLGGPSPGARSPVVVTKSPAARESPAQSVTRSPFVGGSPFAGRSVIVGESPASVSRGSPSYTSSSPATTSRAPTVHHGPTSSAKMSDQKKFIDDALKAHNSYRARHQVAPLSHNKDLSAHAQKWAEHLAARDQFQHSDCNYKGERVGENIAMKWSSEPAAYTGQEATDQWYSEIKLHQTFGARTSPSGTGHFTQVVWKGSKELGVGRAMTKDNKVIVVANYRPAGNFVGDYAANVLPPKDGKIVLPPEPENKPMRMTYSSDKDGGSGSGGMKSFEDMKKEMFGRHGGDSRGFSSGGGGGESRSTRTYTHTEGSGSNKVTKIVTEETIIKSNGEKIINKTEKVIRG